MPAASAGSRTVTDVGPAISTPPPVAAFSAARLPTTGRLATLVPVPSRSCQLPEPGKPSPVSFVVQTSTGPAAAELPEMTAAYSTPVTGAPGTPSWTRAMAAGVPGSPAPTVTTTVVSLTQRSGAVLPPTVAVSFLAVNAVAVAPNPEPVRGTGVPPAAEAGGAVVGAVTGGREPRTSVLAATLLPPAPVTTTWKSPSAPEGAAGAVKVTVVAVLPVSVAVAVTVESVTETRLTPVAVDAFLTVAVTVVPPSVLARDGLRAVTTGSGARYRTLTDGAAPPVRLTTMGAVVPAAAAGTRTTMCASSIHVTVAARPPTVAVILFAVKAAAVVPKPEPTSFTLVATSLRPTSPATMPTAPGRSAVTTSAVPFGTLAPDVPVRTTR